MTINSETALATMMRDPAMIEDVRVLSQVNNWRAAVAIARQWIIIAATVAAAIYLHHWAAYCIAIVIIASRQHTLVVLMHDATHYRLFTNRTANDLISDLFCAYPQGITTLGYRLEHLPHHGGLNTEDDPYYRMFQDDEVWQFPKSRLAALRVFLADLFIWNLPRNLTMWRRWAAFSLWLRHRHDPKLASRCLRDLILSAIFHCTVIATVIWFNVWQWYLLLWALPALTFFMLFVRLRWISEHTFRPATNQVRDTRHVNGTIFERLFVAPLNINYHIAHHLYTSVPFYNLPALHKRLMSEPHYAAEARSYSSYFSTRDSVFSELLVRKLPQEGLPIVP
jgi:fatty acid desaturase